MANNRTTKRAILPARYHTALELLTGEQAAQIHRASLHILEHTGMHMPYPRAWEALAGEGAGVDHTAGRVYFPPDLVERALGKAPRAFTLYARDPQRDLPLDGRHGYLTLDGSGLQVMDLNGGAVRRSTKADLEQATRVADYMEQIAFMWPVVSAQDFPQAVQPLHELAAQLTNTTKHIQAMTAVNGRAARGSVELAALAAGGSRALKERPLISNFQCSISPLAYDAAGLEAALIFAEAGIPVGFLTMQIGCSTAPATLAGNLAQGNAEILAGITFLQSVFPGAPTFYGSCATVMELKSGGVACGGPEDFFLQAAAAQMARFYNLPSNVGTFATGAKTPGWHAGVENAVSGAASIFAGADMMCGAGLLNGARIFSFEQLLMDCEIFEIMRRVAQGIVVDEETLALDTIHRVGSENHFMMEPHTLAHMRELWQPDVMDRTPYEQWHREGKKEAQQTAHEKAARILENHQPEPLDPKLLQEMEKVILSYTTTTR
ncbi:MAG: trimethylamine methyltransferase family protein [Bacillota bacterium]